MRTLNRLGWDWHENGAIITVVVDGSPVAWFIPLDHIQVTFGQELSRVGCPLAPTVGAYPTVSGFFSSIKKAYKKATRAVKKTIPKSIKRAARKVQKTALKGAKAVANLQRKAIKAAGYVPGLKNISRAALDAHNIASRGVLQGKGPSLKQLGRFAKSAGRAGLDIGAQSLNVVVPGAGIAAQAALQAGLGAGEASARGERWDRALKAGVARGATRFGVPEAVTRGALAAGGDIVRGKRVDRALLRGGLQAAEAYVPQNQLAREAFRSGSGLLRGERLDRTVKKALLRQSKGLKGLSRVVPNPQAMAAAKQAFRTAQQAERAAQRVRQGLNRAHELRNLKAGRVAAQGLRQLRSHARMGDPRAREFMAAMRRVGRFL